MFYQLLRPIICLKRHSSIQKYFHQKCDFYYADFLRSVVITTTIFIVFIFIPINNDLTKASIAKADHPRIF